MSKSYNNYIGLRDDPDSVAPKIRTMQTDPKRVRRTDPGDPEKCPGWELHKISSAADPQVGVPYGCRRACIGCLDCKKPLIDSIVEEQRPLHERAREYENNPDLVHSILQEGREHARDAARDTLEEVRAAMGLHYR